MKKTLKIAMIIVCSVLIVVLSSLIYVLSVTAGVKINEEKLVNMERIISYYDINGNKFAEESGGVAVTEIKNIPEYVKNAFIAIEDKRFYSHNGVDYRGLFRALFNNVKSFSFKEGASTISQQLIKNTHLSNEKTLKRKLVEIKLARKLEKKFTKSEILEKYLNTIYFGDGCYGITEASKHYFNKQPFELDINEGAILAAIIKAPTYYSPLADTNKCFVRKNIVLSEMLEQGYITIHEFNENKNKAVTTIENKDLNHNFLSLAKSEYCKIMKNYSHFYNNFNVYTSFNPNLQQILESEKIDTKDYENSSIILDEKSRILAYCSTIGNLPRQVGSTIKPLLVYAPAIETNAVYSCSPILDEKTDFNGYNPSNYNEKYYGYISVKESLAKSLNTCAVKLLNQVGVDKAKSFIKNTDITLDKEDDSLCLALGATNKGIKLTDLTSAYSVFLNKGSYVSSSCINKIETNEKEVIYQKKSQGKRVFSQDTIDIMNDMLSFVVTNGTAKKLSFLNMPIYAKTGTVGSEKGNTDSYTISYTSEYVLGTWCGNKENTLMSNAITGGGVPCVQSANIWEKVYKNKLPKKIENSNKTCEEFIDKITYDNDHRVILADLKALPRYTEKMIFKKNALPKERSSIFSSPIIEKPKISIKNNEINILLCLTEYYDAIIYKTINGKKFAVYDTENNNKKIYVDHDLIPNQNYTYSVVPYHNNGAEKIYGKEIIIETIKIPKAPINDWWKNELD